MINENQILIREKRPIERRGRKKALPLIEMETSFREEVLSNLFNLSQYLTSANQNLYVNLDSNTLNLLSLSGSLQRNLHYKAHGKQ